MTVATQHMVYDEEQAKEARLASLVENAQDVIIGVESNGEIWGWNRSAERLFGYSEREVLGRSVAFLVAPDGTRIVEHIARASCTPETFSQLEAVCRCKDGTQVPLWLCISPVPGTSTTPPSVSIVAHDMRSKQVAEDVLRQSLKDKELLLKELHHRVKNNLQIICSLLRLQSGYLAEGPARTMLRSSEERVKCMALVHEELYRSASLSQIGFHVYASELTKQLLRSHGIAPERSHLSLDLEPVELSIDKAVPSGLILNELIANAIEHGCGPDGVLSLSIELRKRGTRIEFRISDRGPGLGRDFDLLTCSSLGIRMVNTLCKQLRGRLSAEDDHGAVFTLEFPP